jgi:methylthioribulose-1-phosphate dehydratase
MANLSPEARICDMMAKFHRAGWCTGSGGGISLRDPTGTLLVAPSGVNKELLKVEDIIHIDGKTGARLKGGGSLKPSACLSIFQGVYEATSLMGQNFNACIHSHSRTFIAATNIFKSEFKITNMEMIKGIPGYKNSDVLAIPIIENTHDEEELASHVRAALKVYPNTPAVLVRNHGIYVWGETWERCKINAEVIDYLCAAAQDLMGGGGGEKRKLADISEDGVLTPAFGRVENKISKPRSWNVPENCDSPLSVNSTVDGQTCCSGCPKSFVPFSILEGIGVKHDMLSG